MTNIVKFPYIASRRVHSRKPRISKNGTPEEREAKAAAAAAELTSATVTEIPGRLAKAAEAAPPFVEFLAKLKRYVVQEFARGQDIDPIFDGLEASYGRAEKAVQKYRKRSQQLPEK